MSDEALETLASRFDVESNQKDAPLSAAQLQRKLKDKDAAITLITDVISETLLAAAPRLKVVSNVAVGYNNFDPAHGGGVVEAGQHRIDLSAPGYDPLAVDVRIAPTQTITYRERLKRTQAPALPGGPTTFYLIPGCYMGNVPPKDAHLPATCDLGRAVEFKY